MLDILLPSAYFCDLIFTGLPDIPSPGAEVFSQGLKVIPGAGFIPAVALTRLGLQADWACDFGNDFFSRYVLEEAGRQNLNSRLFRIHDQPLQAIAVAYSFANDRAFLSYMDPLPQIDLPAMVKKNPARCVMFMSWQIGSDFTEVVHTAHNQGSLVFVDGQVAGEANLSDPQVVAILQSIDLFAVNQMEALQLTGEETIESALEYLAKFTPTVVIKLGAGGAVAWSKGELARLPGISAQVVDTTGAGDNFDCGFLYGRLRGYSLKDCLRCGNFCGSRSTTSYGGWDASPTADELETFMEKKKV